MKMQCKCMNAAFRQRAHCHPGSSHSSTPVFPERPAIAALICRLICSFRLSDTPSGEFQHSYDVTSQPSGARSTLACPRGPVLLLQCAAPLGRPRRAYRSLCIHGRQFHLEKCKALAVKQRFSVLCWRVLLVWCAMRARIVLDQFVVQSRLACTHEKQVGGNPPVEHGASDRLADAGFVMESTERKYCSFSWRHGVAFFTESEIQSSRGQFSSIHRQTCSTPELGFVAESTQRQSK